MELAVCHFLDMSLATSPMSRKSSTWGRTDLTANKSAKNS